MHNRAERRAIARGEGRKRPMVSIEDIPSTIDYEFALTVGVYIDAIDENLSRLFIYTQAAGGMGDRDEFLDDDFT